MGIIRIPSKKSTLPPTIKILQSGDRPDGDIVAVALGALVVIFIRVEAGCGDDFFAVSAVEGDIPPLHDKLLTLLAEGGDIHEVAVRSVFGHTMDG